MEIQQSDLFEVDFTSADPSPRFPPDQPSCCENQESVAGSDTLLLNQLSQELQTAFMMSVPNINTPQFQEFRLAMNSHSKEKQQAQTKSISLFQKRRDDAERNANILHPSHSIQSSPENDSSQNQFSQNQTIQATNNLEKLNESMQTPKNGENFKEILLKEGNQSNKNSRKNIIEILHQRSPQNGNDSKKRSILNQLKMRQESYQCRNQEDQLTQQSNIHDFSFSQQLNNSASFNQAYDEQDLQNCITQQTQLENEAFHVLKQQYQDSLNRKEFCYQKEDQYEIIDGVSIAFKHSLEFVKSKWSLRTEWPESSPIRIEFFSLEMQSLYGSFYKNKEDKRTFLKEKVVDKDNYIAYLEAWKKIHQLSKREAMLLFIQLTEKNRQFLESLGLQQNLRSNKSEKHSSTKTFSQTGNLRSSLRMNNLKQNLRSSTQSIQSLKAIQNEQNKLNRQSTEDLHPRQPPSKILLKQDDLSNNSQHEAKLTGSAKKQKRTRADRERSKTPPSQEMNSGEYAKRTISQNFTAKVPKQYQISTSKLNHNFYNTTHGLSQQQYSENNSQYSDELKPCQSSKLLRQSMQITSNLELKCFNSVNEALESQSLSLYNTPNNISASYKNPFKKNLKEKQRMKALQKSIKQHSPRKLMINKTEVGSPREIVHFEAQSPKILNSHRQQQNQVYQDTVTLISKSPKHNIHNCSSDESPDVPKILNAERLSVYSQSQLISELNQSKGNNFSHPHNKEEKVQVYQVNRKKQGQKQKVSASVPLLDIKALQKNSDLLNREEQDRAMHFIGHSRLNSDLQEVLNEEQATLPEQVLNFMLDKFEEQIQSQVSERSILQPDNQIEEKNQIGESLSDLVQQQISRNSPARIQESLVIQALEEERIYSKHSKENNFSSQCLPEDQILSQNEQNIEQSHEESLPCSSKFTDKDFHGQESDMTQSNPQIISDIISSQLPQIHSQNQNLVKSSTKISQLEIIQDPRIIETEFSEDSSQKFQANILESADPSQEQQSQITDYPKAQRQIHHLSLTPIMKARKNCFTFSKAPLRQVQQNSNIEVIDQSSSLFKKSQEVSFHQQQCDSNMFYNEVQVEVLSNQDCFQQGRDYSPISVSRVKQYQEKINYSFQNYIRLEQERDKENGSNLFFQINFEEINTRNQNLTNEIKRGSFKNSILMSQNLSKINTQKVPKVLEKIVSFYNEEDSLFHKVLLGDLNINDSVKYEDENISMFISQLRLDQQQTQEIQEGFCIKEGVLSKYSLIRAKARVEIPSAKVLYDSLSFPSNEIFSSTGLSQIRQQQTSSYSEIYKTLRQYDGLQVTRSSHQIYFWQQLEDQEEGVIVITKMMQPYNSRFNLFEKDYDNFLQVIKIRTIQAANKSGEKDLVEIKIFYCVDYNLLIDDEMKSNNVKIAVQEIQTLIEAVKSFGRQL